MAAASESSPPAAPQDRPAAQAFRVEDLIASVRAGRVRIPKFQRPLKWGLADVLSLLDSIYRGYPVGTLLLWRRPAGPDHIVHGAVQIAAPAVTEALWVVDGQQRIVSLTRTLTGAGFPDEPFAAFFDLHLGVFVRPPRRETTPPHYLPLTEVLDSERLIEWLLVNKVPPTERAAAIRVGRRIREFDIPAYALPTCAEPARWCVPQLFYPLFSSPPRRSLSCSFCTASGCPLLLTECALRCASRVWRLQSAPTTCARATSTAPRIGR